MNMIRNILCIWFRLVQVIVSRYIFRIFYHKDCVRYPNRGAVIPFFDSNRVYHIQLSYPNVFIGDLSCNKCFSK